MTVAILFARADSHYKALAGCDVWDAERDARKWARDGEISPAPEKVGRDYYVEESARRLVGGQPARLSLVDRLKAA